MLGPVNPDDVRVVEVRPMLGALVLMRAEHRNFPYTIQVHAPGLAEAFAQVCSCLDEHFAKPEKQFLDDLGIDVYD